ncbi:hypothetical protein E1258_09515 [Micromonospora sp. KC207]|uniref:hypothetical protein n=1 Tax=Micromonospora sp. KC207 TaxID=2530377 RepID=UPI0010450F39|nr:hypothetical protein [Micromonospora sp. KC207]TDC63874.1 hypothetical protein E1258_09515 [Micromonospora sp. KC207]
MAFPADPLPVAVELEIDGAWVNIAAAGDVFGGERDQISITRGRRSEGGRVDPTRVGLSIRNSSSTTSGTYSPRNPLSPYYGKIGRNTQMRASVGTAHLGAGDGTATASTSHVAPSVTATGAGLLICGWMSDNPVNYTLPGSMTAGPAETDGTYSTLRTAYEAVTAGATGTRTATASTSQGYVAVSAVAHGTSVAVEETLSGVSSTLADVTLTTDAATEAGWWLVAVQGWVRGSDVAMPDAPYGDDGGWVLLGDSDSLTGDFSSITTYLRLRVWARRVNTAGAQTVIFAGSSEPGAADNQAALYVLSGVSDWLIRATVEVPEWPPRWDVTGTDVWVPIAGAGVLRRLGQGSSPLWSPIRRALTGAGASVQVGRSLLPVDYWSLEDVSGSTEAASALSGRRPARAQGTVSWAAVDTAGSQPIPDWSAGGSLSAPITGITETGDWGVGCRINISGTTSWTALAVAVSGGLYDELRLVLTSTTVAVDGVDESGTSTIVGPIVESVMDGDDHWIEVWERDAGGTLTWEVYLDGAVLVSGVDSGSPGRPTSVRVLSRTSGEAGLGHLAVWADPTVATWPLVLEGAVVGHAGESAGRRVERLCREEGVAIHIVGDPDASAAMGVQPTGTLLDLLRQCEDADGGVLYEPRETLGLAYRTAASRYNQAATLGLTYGATAEVAPPLEPSDDDRYTRNDVTVTRSGGSSARAEVDEGPLSVLEPPDGVGRYDTAATLNVHTDEQLPSQAWWRAHLGTWDEERYPTIRVNLAALHAAGKTALAEAAASLDCGDRLTIASTPVWLPPGPVDQHGEGYTETLAQYVWDLRLVCSPAGPWRVFVVGDQVLGRLDTAGSELALAAGEADTSLVVATDAGRRPWITDADRPQDFPFHAGFGGEMVQVTGISGPASPQIWTVVRSVNGITKEHPAGTRVRLAYVEAS